MSENVLRKWVKELSADPAQAFPIQDQMKTEQLAIEQLRREVTKLKAERDILKKAVAHWASEFWHSLPSQSRPLAKREPPRSKAEQHSNQ